MAFETQFKQFWGLLTTELELPEGTEEIIHKAWKKIVWNNVKAGTTAPSITPIDGAEVGVDEEVKKVTRLTGYNIFMKETLIELKKDNSMAGTERTREVARRWKEMTLEEKKIWNTKGVSTAVDGPKSVATGPTQKSKIKSPTKEKKTRKPSGYNIFMKEKMAELKQNAFPSDQRMTQIGAMWKALSDVEKQKWKDTASASGLPVVNNVVNNVDNDVDTPTDDVDV